MSAFVVSKNHIEYMLSFFMNDSDRKLSVYHEQNWLYFDLIEQEHFQKAADILYAQNIRSYNFRYKDTVESGIIEWKRNWYPDQSPVKVIKACDCYDYQSTETADYETTLACKIIHSIRRNAILRLEGYKEAQWRI